MPRRKADRGKPRPLRAAPTEVEIDSLLDRIDETALRGDAAGLTPLIERLWESRRQTAEVITRRLLEGRAQVPAFAFELLGGLVGPQAPRYLKRIAEDRGVPDMVRFGARRRAGWPERGEAKRRLEFLGTLRDGETALISATNEATLTWPPDSEILGEVLGYLIALQAERRRAVLQRAVAELHARSSWLLRAVLHLHDPLSQRLALSELVRLGDLGSLGAINRLERAVQVTQIRDEAAAAARRLKMHVVDGAEREESMPLPPPQRTLMSAIDGDGGQVILISREFEGGGLLVADFFFNEAYGLKDAFGFHHATEEILEDMIGELGLGGIDLVEVDLACARGALRLAADISVSTGHDFPPVFELWEPLVHDSFPPREDEPVVVPELDDAPYADRPDLIRAGGRLVDHSFFDFWFLDPERTARALEVTPPPAGHRWSEKQFRPLMQHLLDQSTCSVLRRRLRRQAWLLERTGDDKARDQALAAAAQLAECRIADLAKQPFLRALVQRTVGVVLAETALLEE